MKTHIVLGTLFGDEGKGLTVNQLCKQAKAPLVVRFSGGQQAGHAVIENGVKHIHSSFGSGTLSGVPSYFTEHCTFYLPNMLREYNKLIELKVYPFLAMHPLAMVTTPYDVAYNRFTEKSNKHGSCGLGVAATMKRNLETPYKLYAVDTLNRGVFFEKLNNIKRYYETLFEEGSSNHSKYTPILEQEEKDFKEVMFTKIFHIRDYSMLYKFSDIIFEGSQGIMLDMDHGFFPNVTFANTTSKNAMSIIKQMKLNMPEIYYITRCYQTRHGNGYMSKESPIVLINNEEEINVYNDWQKQFRIGEVDYDLIDHAITIDKIYSNGVNKNLVVTCLDQRENFNFDYKQLTHTFKSIYESRSADGTKFTKL